MTERYVTLAEVKELLEEVSESRKGTAGMLEDEDVLLASQKAALDHAQKVSTISLEDANKTREAIRGGRSYACGLASLVFSRKKAFRLLVEDRAVGTRWNGLPRLLAEREIDEEWVWMDDSQKNVPGDPFPREALVDLLHGTIEALFKAVFRAKSRDEVASVAEKNHAFYVAGCCAVLGLGTDDAPTPGSSGASPPPV